MVWWIISTIIWSITSILRKRSLSLTELKWIRFIIFWLIWWVILWIVFMFLWKVNFNIIFNLSFLLIFISLTTLDTFWSKLEQAVYKKEKLSVLLPFESLQKIFIVIAWFFLFWNTSVFTLIITLITIVVIILFNIDYKDFKIPNYLWLIVFIQVIWTIVALLENAILKVTNVETFFALNDLAKFSFILIFIIILFKKDSLELLKQKKEFYYFRLWAWLLWWLNFLVILFLMSKLWIVVTILLSFLWMIFRLILSYLILKEIPWKKDVILAIIVAILIWIWYYFW